MNAPQNDRFDTTTTAAWTLFTDNLHRRLQSLPRGDYLTVTAAQATPGERGLRPYVDVAAVSSRSLLAVAARPSRLYPTSSGCIGQDEQMLADGWQRDGKPLADGSVIDLTRTARRIDAATVADAVVECFRAVWNVPHPSFLSAWAVSADSAASGPVDLARSTELRPGRAPAELKSLQALCQLVRRPVDARTVRSVCTDLGLDVLGPHARELHLAAAERARRLAEADRSTDAAVWRNLARTWLLVARSIETAERADRQLSS